MFLFRRRNGDEKKEAGVSWIRSCSSWQTLVVATVLLVVVFLAAFLPTIIHGTGSPIVDLGYSKYRGTSLPIGVSQWLGIRYAAPPLGDLRFRAPRPPLNQTSVINAKAHGGVCLPTATSIPRGHDEDCLFLDVYAPTPSLMRPKKFPVYIFIQGGGFNFNSNPNYNGSGLIQASGNGIVVVTFNYRVGLYGFLASKEIEANGDINVGNLDQRMVFKWVQEHIEKFGGDPNQVTIGGPSAGGASVDLHLTAYSGRNDNLFHAVAAESQSFGPQFNVSETQYQYDALISRTNCTGGDTLTCLRSVNINTLQSVNIQIPTPGGGSGAPLFMYSNVLDGSFTTDYTYNLYAQGKFIRVPSIFGADTNDGTVFAPRSTATLGAMHTFLKDQFPRLTTAQIAEIDTLYPQNTTQTFPGAGKYWRVTSDAYGNMRYECPGLYISSAIDKAGVQANWNYRFNVEDLSLVSQGYGVVHTQEVALIWGPNFTSSAGSNPSSYSTSNVDMVAVMQGYWTSFIRSGDPNKYRAAGTPVWERFSAQNQSRIVFQNGPGEGNTTQMETVSEQKAERCAYLSGIGPTIQQ